MSAVYYGDLKNTALIGQSLKVAARTTNMNGTGVDMLAGDGNNCSAIAAIVSGDVASTDETYALTIEESDDNVTFVAIQTNLPNSSFEAKTAVAAAWDGLAYVEIATFQRTKRYVRAVLTVGGTSPAWTGSVLFIERKRITGTGTGYQS